jgi:ATP-dependent protease ClpP protease subunit
VISPNPDYRPNPQRAIFVQGSIDQELIDRLTPEILLLHSEDRTPITVYIDSLGGSPALMESLFRLLKSSSQDFDPPCRIITVVTTKAASAAADLLSSGDYALAFPDSTIWFHGVRVPGETVLTAEQSSLLAQYLRTRNKRYAAELTRKTETRFMFRFMSMKSEFASVRASSPQLLSNLDCFLALIKDKVSETAQEVINKAHQRYHRYEDLFESALRYKLKDNMTLAEFDAFLLRAIITFEVRNNKKDSTWSFRGDGLQQLTDDFFLLQEHLENFNSASFRKQCASWGKFLLTDTDLEEIYTFPETERPQKTTEKVRPLLQPIWSFFVALCNVLQQGENDLNATDAFWLGLIDEIIGVPDLPCSRILIEYTADPEVPKETPPEVTEELATQV